MKAQLEKCLSHKHEDLSLNPYHTHTEAGHIAPTFTVPALGGEAKHVRHVGLEGQPVWLNQ